MADKISAAARSANMARVKGRNTRPEMIVRRLTHAMGYRYRLHVRDLPGKPDLVFRSRQKVIFVHGCFWHRHEGCRRATTPQSNEAFWREKLSRNADRDAEQIKALNRKGWKVLVIWECQIRDRDAIAATIQSFLEGPTGF
jgi:DNA mismatch endonuclease (patch repair protein)